MNTNRFDRIERLFKAAQMHAPEERAAFLDAACADDPALRQEIDELLRADHRAEEEDFLEGMEAGLATELLENTEDSREENLKGKSVGPYVLLRRLGHGGMGDVFLAIRERPFKHYVALKIIRPGMDTRDVVARFTVERQILAALNHPNIARLLDGGVTEEGLPYFAMEYVDGHPITTYCDEHRLALRDRLKLFQTVCEAVHYAHQNLVIHRDLKPSNILVTENKTVKLLDFGIAKLLNPHLSPVDMPVTRTELRLMTPEYASPEQVRGEPLTTAADVYALGMILYELLTGHRPYQVAGRPTQEIISVVCEQEPERPSTRITKAEKLKRPDGSEKVINPATVGASRGMPVERLRRQIRGDLDNISLMALRKEHDRRYGSAEQFGQDIERYLSGMPVLARPNTLGYRTRKFTERHRATVVAAVLILISLVGGLSAALWQAREAHQERDRAEQALVRSETVTDFLMALFRASDPRETRGVEVTARELLQRGVERAEALREEPEVQAHLLDVIGRVYESLGQYEPAREFLTRGLQLRRQEFGQNHLLVAESMTHLGDVLTRRGDYEEAESLFGEARRIQSGLLVGPDQGSVYTLMGLGYLLPFRSKWEEAEAAYREALAMQRELTGGDDPQAARIMVRIGSILRSRGRYDEAEALLREALDEHTRLQGAAHIDATGSMFQLAILLKLEEKYDEVETLLRRAIDLRTDQGGENDPEISSYMFELGETLALKGEAVEAEQMFRKALAIRKRVFGDHPGTGDGLLFTALFLHSQGKMSEADSLFKETLSLRQRLFGNEHQEVAVVLRRLGELYIDMGRYREADSLFARAYTMHVRVNGPDHHHVGDALVEIARLREATGDLEHATSLYLEALPILRKQYPDEHVDVQNVFRRITLLYEQRGIPDEAAKYRQLLNQTSANP